MCVCDLSLSACSPGLHQLQKQGFRVYFFLLEVIIETRFQGLFLSFGSYPSNFMQPIKNLGSGDSSVVRAPDS